MTLRPHTIRRTAIGALLAAVCTCALAAHHRAGAQADWSAGDIVGLSAGTCIREGPGFSYRAHTRVPEDDWLVMVIDGPRTADGRTWYDTSRAAAGDPSGGTGWVDRSQRDMCPLEGPPRQPERPVPRPDDWLKRIGDWWRDQGSTGKWLAALVGLAVIVWLWSRLALSVWGLVRVLVLGVIIWWLLDATRDVWSELWRSVAGSDAPDLALLLAFLPAISYLLPRLLGLGRLR